MYQPSTTSDLTSSKTDTTLSPPELSLSQKLLRLAAASLAVGVFVWAYHGAEMRLFELWRDSGNMLEFAKGFAKPDFMLWRDYTTAMVTTFQIALWGTALSVAFAIPCSLLSSSNVCPAWIRQPVRRAMDALRSINELVFAMFFVSAVGLGPFAGVLALFVHNLGTLSKLFSECVEAIDEGPLQGVRATGANKVTEISFGILPQVMPLWTSYTLYRFESNVRSATVLGIIGAGGIGAPLYEAIRGFDYSSTAAILIVIIIAVILIDMASARIRKSLI